jgi:hypothetical protein
VALDGGRDVFSLGGGGAAEGALYDGVLSITDSKTDPSITDVTVFSGDSQVGCCCALP